MNTHHSINYIEMASVDMQHMKDFYKTVFDWTFQDYGPNYCEFHDKAITGGFDSSLTPSSAGVTVIFYSDNLEQSEKQIIDAGGIITIPVFEFPGGRRFHFSDPSGNHLAVWSKH